jgi:hypothetical protein
MEWEMGNGEWGIGYIILYGVSIIPNTAQVWHCFTLVFCEIAIAIFNRRYIALNPSLNAI